MKIQKYQQVQFKISLIRKYFQNKFDLDHDKEELKSNYFAGVSWIMKFYNGWFKNVVKMVD